jgi:phosphotransferase family enzyme
VNEWVSAMTSSVVTSVAKMVFPQGAELCTKSEEDTSGSKFWLIPGKEGEPRWILPDEHKYALPFLQQWSPYDLLSRIKWKLLQIAYRGKGLALIPGVIPLRINIPEKSNWKHLGWPHSRPPVPVIYIGHPRRQNRKAVLGLVDFQENKVKSISKVPLVSSASLAINHEVDLLDALAKEKPGQAPRTLFVDRKKGISTQEFFTGSPTGRILTKRHVKFLIDLAIPGESISFQEILEDIEARIRTSDYIDTKIRDVLERVLEEANNSSELPAVWEHGDFAPWNLICATDGSLRAIDWETASRKGLPLFDLVHFHSIQAFQFGENQLFPKSSRDLFNQYINHLGIESGMARKIIKICLAKDWLRRFEEGDHLHADFLLNTLVKPSSEFP